ncbi:MAG: roadblock/LC7 domain-containing protein [Euryarchaeota archaeon]|nr:roadblock/LC7 domain-containing protein [Euryarchaeota archaeon]
MRKELLDEVLDELKEVINAEASAIATRSGLLISSEIPEGIDGETFTALAATILGAAETTTSEIKKKAPERVIVETEETRIITMGAGEKALLVCMTSEPDLEMLLKELDKAAEKVEKVL